jgi:hypothetical protein
MKETETQDEEQGEMSYETRSGALWALLMQHEQDQSRAIGVVSTERK